MKIHKKLMYTLGAAFLTVVMSLFLSFGVSAEEEPGTEQPTQEDVRIDKATFPDTTFRSYVSREYDKNKDNALSAEEITEVEWISLSSSDGKSISSLKGIEVFTSCKDLNIISVLEGNFDSGVLPGLENLSVKYCKKLKKLDVSRNKELTSLDCSDNALTSLTVKGATKLKSLTCSSNKLKTLDVCDNKELVQILCGNNLFTSISLQGLENLETFECNNNKLKTLDLSSNKNLKWLVITSNPYLYVDLRNNKKIENVSTTSYYDQECMVICTQNQKELGWRKIEINPFILSTDPPTKTFYVVDDGGTPKKSHLAIGVTKIGKKEYYFDNNGVLTTGVVNVSGKLYIFDNNGKRKTKGWQKYKGKKYYLDSTGACFTGWQKIGGKKYYFFDDGQLASSEWINGKWFNADGTQTYKKKAAWKSTSLGKRYDDAAHKYAKNQWVTIDRKEYFFDGLGYYVKNAKKVGKSAAIPTTVKCKVDYQTKTAILKRLNQIRKEAYKLGLIDKYTPVKWSYDLEEISFLRAAEASFYFSHSRPNKGGVVKSSNGKTGYGETLAGSNTILGGIEAWYGEKKDYIRYKKGEDVSFNEIGHYGVLIHCEEIGIACFDNCVAGSPGADKTLTNAKRYATKKRNTITIELRPEDGELKICRRDDSFANDVSVLDICAGETMDLKACFGMGDKEAIGKWYSLNKSVVKANSSGKIKALKKGTTSIVFRDGAFTKKIKIRVHVPASKLKKTVWGYNFVENENIYHFVEDGGWYPTNQFITLKGKKYYLKDDGTMAKNEWVNGYCFLKNGVLKSSKKAKWIYMGNKRKYGYSKTKCLKSKKVIIDGYTHRFNAKGYEIW